MLRQGLEPPLCWLETPELESGVLAYQQVHIVFSSAETFTSDFHYIFLYSFANKSALYWHKPIYDSTFKLSIKLVRLPPPTTSLNIHLNSYHNEQFSFWSPYKKTQNAFQFLLAPTIIKNKFMHFIPCITHIWSICNICGAPFISTPLKCKWKRSLLFYIHLVLPFLIFSEGCRMIICIKCRPDTSQSQ